MMDTWTPAAKAMPAVKGLRARVLYTLNFTGSRVPEQELLQNCRTACGVIFSLKLQALPTESPKSPKLFTEKLHLAALVATV